ncbi:hypothetical protein JCM25156A_13090 [Komagataeibacter kakiaceti JCM 25156]|uniref:glycosyltransferase family 25 protein n=1 Tax=Komagataeibacter kakiaceti TaxID=943261 RepID=UPI00046EA811|nr:glycosyltransferase family 25 protein [Komagataeibacter kakiaceti]
MNKFFISLERTPERTARFREANAHIQGLVHAPGIDGSVLDIDSIRQQHFLQADCQFTRGAIGSGLTHVALWGTVAKSGVAAHIFEDDAFLCRNFEEESQRIIASLPEDWDIILWGNNSDTVLQFDLLPGITQCVATFSQDSVREGIHTFRNMDVTSLPFRLDHTFGICGYAISPSGADKMIRSCLPMKTVDIVYPSLGGRRLTATSIDHLMNLHYREMKAYTCLPPLCLTDNQTAQSLNK